MEHFRRGFISLYSTSLVEAFRSPNHDVQWRVQLSDEDKNSIGALVTPKEIKNALWSMKP